MKKLIAALLALTFVFALSSCAEPSKSEVVSYVTEAVGESVSFVSSERAGGITYYKFLLDDRQFTFDAVVKGGEISVYYEQGIADALSDRRDDLCAAFGVTYDKGVIDVRDHDAAAAFICALDALYSFNEEIPDHLIHISGGAYDSGTSVFEGIAFSTNASTRIQAETVLTYLAEYSKFD